MRLPKPVHELARSVRAQPIVNSAISRMLRQLIRAGRWAEKATDLWWLYGTVPLEICGQRILVHSEGDDWLTKTLFYEVSTETHELLLWSKLGRYCRGALDVGAHTGIYSILLKKISPECRVCCFEPDPANFARLDTNLRLNQCDAVRRFPWAISEHPGRVKFATRRGGYLSLVSSTASEFTESYFPGHTAEIEVDAETLDRIRLHQDLGPLQLIKIDVEGAELSVLRGAQVLLRSDQPAILCESHCWEVLAAEQPGLDVPQMRKQQLELQSMLLDFGYHFYTLTEHGLWQVDELGRQPHNPNFLFTATKKRFNFVPYADVQSLRALLPD